MKLYDYFRSSAAYRVRIALNLKGLAPERAFVHLRKGAQRGDDYLAVNPQGLVPALVDRRRHGAHPVARDHRVPGRDASGAAAAAGGRRRARARAQPRAGDRLRHPSDRQPARAALPAAHRRRRPKRRRTRGTSTGSTSVSRRSRSQLSRDPATGRFCHGDSPTLADICLVPQLANARRVDIDLVALSDAVAHRGGVPSDCRRSRTRRRAATRRRTWIFEGMP